MKLKLFVLLVLLMTTLTSRALSTWDALSQLESGDNDYVVGSHHEHSRYQIRPQEWHANALPGMSWYNPNDALWTAQRLMAARCMKFVRQYGRNPTNFEFYVLYNAPAQIQHPSPAVKERASRFVNLVNKI